MSKLFQKYRWIPVLALLVFLFMWQNQTTQAHSGKTKLQMDKERQSGVQEQLRQLSRQVKVLQARDIQKSNEVRRLQKMVVSLAKKIGSLKKKTQVHYRSCTIKGYHQSVTGDGTNTKVHTLCHVTFTPPSKGLLLAQLAGFGSNESGRACRYGIRFEGESQTGIHSGEVYFSTDRKRTNFHAIFPVASTRALRVEKSKRLKVSIVIVPMEKAKCTATASKLHVMFIPGA